MTDASGESDLRRRAAWLLAMLVVAAVLVVVVMTRLLDSSGGGGASTGLAGPDDTLTPSATATAAATSSRPTPRPSSGTPSTGGSGPSAYAGPSTTTCPSTAACVLQGDPAEAIAAVNAYRQAHGQHSLPGTVSPAAQRCALSDGSDCSGGWAETYLGRLDGTAAVTKIAGLAKLLDPQMTSFGIGWAYKPTAKTYYLAVVRSGG